jgi:hypothetical protein
LWRRYGLRVGVSIGVDDWDRVVSRHAVKQFDKPGTTRRRMRDTAAELCCAWRTTRGCPDLTRSPLGAFGAAVLTRPEE